MTVTKPQMDAIYGYAAELFSIDQENLTDMPISRSPDGQGNMALVTFGFNFRGDRYVKDVRKIDTTTDKSFS